MTQHISLRWLRVTIGYFAIIGFIVHLAVAGLWLLRPEVIWKVRDTLTAKLAEHFDFIAIASDKLESEQADLSQMIPQWQPLFSSTPAPEPQTLRIGHQLFTTFDAALAAIKPGQTLEIGPGIYNSPLVIRVDQITILGYGRVLLERGLAEGKANIVIKSNNVQVRNLECQLISAPDGNGACIRLEGNNIFVEHVYFHDSDQGILTGSNPGLVHIRDSRFERLGLRGQAHGIYIGGGKLLVENSLFLSSKDEGHEIKTRAQTSTIVNTVIASLNSRDSRLIDVPNGGSLTVEGCLLAEGQNSSNGDMIGFALEAPDQTTTRDRVILRDNLIFLERNGPNQLLHLGNQIASVTVTSNLIVTTRPTGYDNDNVVYKTRTEAGLPAYPMLPIERFLPPVSNQNQSQ